MSIITDLQAAAKVLQKAGNVELYEKLLAVQEKALEIMEENKNLKQKIEQLGEALKIKDSIVFEKNVCWLKNKEGEVREGPFCPKCYDDEKLLIHFIKEQSHDGEDYYTCPKCNLLINQLR